MFKVLDPRTLRCEDGLRPARKSKTKLLFLWFLFVTGSRSWVLLVPRAISRACEKPRHEDRRCKGDGTCLCVILHPIAM